MMLINYHFCDVGRWTISQHGFPVVGPVRISSASSTTKHSWAVKTTSQLEKPRYVIFALQTERRNVLSQNDSQFDTCNLTNVKLFLNSDFYPYDDMNLDIERNKFAILYNMYVKRHTTVTTIAMLCYLSRNLL